METLIVIKKKELWEVSKNGVIWGMFADKEKAQEFAKKYSQLHPNTETWEIGE